MKGASVPVTAQLVAATTSIAEMVIEGGQPWSDQQLDEHAFYLAATHSLDELAQRGAMLIEAVSLCEHRAIELLEDDP